MELIAVSLIIFLYFFFALFRKRLEKFIPFRFCAICYSVSLTLIALFLLDASNLFEVDPVLISILMGGSVVGIMYRLEKYFKDNKLRNFWIVRIGFVVLAILFSYYLLNRKWDNLMLVVILIIFGITFAFIFSKQIEQSTKKSNKLFGKIGKDLENCCD